MAKEMMIIFVYDTQMLQREEDDPTSAVLYFHPTWVSDQQKTSLCGQVMGTIHCVKSIFSVPKIISLQSGKFYLKEYGRYLLAVGTDRNIADWLLEHRANTVSSLISFFHQDIVVMSKIYNNTSKLSAKLYQLFETYLKYLFVGGNIFSCIPSIKLPKSTSNVFLEAIHILQSCQELDHVLGGTLLYHNKVVATQLSSDLTKCLVLADPYRIKCPAEIPQANFDVPLGVQLFQVYISSKEFNKLHEESSKSRNIFQCLSNKSLKMTHTKPKEPIISAMKRDQSLIFTAVLEEESEHQPVKNTVEKKPVKTQTRPKFLNLRSKTTDVEVKSKPIPTTPFQANVSSTPMTELNKVIYSKPLSICTNPVAVDPVDEETCDKIEKLEKHIKVAAYLNIKGSLYDSKKYSSMFDVREQLKSISKSITMKYYKLETLKLDECEVEKKVFKTITDPTYPIFKADGTALSYSFYEDYVTNQMIMDGEKESKQIDHFKKFDWSLPQDKKVELKATLTTDKLTSLTVKQNHRNSTATINQEHRKSLTLPLKSLSMDSASDQILSPDHRYSSGVYLTPLMSKLSSFTLDESRSSGFVSCDATPAKDFRMFTPTQSNMPFSFKKYAKTKNFNANSSLQKCVLFVCGQKDMVINLLLQDDSHSSQELITKLWEICTENLGSLEKQLHHCLDTYPGSSTQSDTEPYSFLYLDPEWDTLQRAGPWGSAELGTLTYFHRDFKEAPNLTEILMRCSDSVIYGYQCGKSEVFYHQAASTNAGLPTPADPMGTVPLKAKRRLERDHAIILL